MQQLLVFYKSAILKTRSAETNAEKRSMLHIVMLHILLPSLTKPRHHRSERDTGTISMCLHLFRNLVAIQDPTATSLSSAEMVALSNLQNELIEEMQSSHVLDTMLMFAGNAETRDFEPWNVVTTEFVYHLFAGGNPSCLLERSSQQSCRGKEAPLPANTLQKLLLAESQDKRNQACHSTSTRHSRFTTSLQYKDSTGQTRTATSQASLRKSAEQLEEDLRKRRRRICRRKKVEEEGAARKRMAWSIAASQVLAKWSDQFLETGFESLIRSVVKDIRSESAKIINIDQTRTRVMQVSDFFLNYFLQMRELHLVQASSEKNREEVNARKDLEAPDESSFSFSAVEYWLEPWALKMAWMRAIQARDDRAWLEYVVSVRLWTTLLNLVEALGKSREQDEVDKADGIQALHFYDEIALDAAKSITKSYTSQSFRCLESIVDFAFVMPRLLERYSKDKGNLYVKVKRQMRKSKESEVMNADEEHQQVQRVVDSKIKERKFEFQRFQGELCSNQLVDACLTYLTRWQEIADHAFEHVNGVIHVLHRIVVKAGSVRLLFPHRRRMALKSLQSDQLFWQFVRREAPLVQSDTSRLIEYVLSKFHRLDEEEKAHWAEGMKAPRPVKVFKMPPEIEIRPSRGQEEDVRIAVGLLVEKELSKVVFWIKGALEEASRIRNALFGQQSSMHSSGMDSSQDSQATPVHRIGEFSDFREYTGPFLTAF